MKTSTLMKAVAALACAATLAANAATVTYSQVGEQPASNISMDGLPSSTEITATPQLAFPGVTVNDIHGYCKTSRAVRREIKIARMKQALCKLVAGGLHCDVDGVYSTMNVVSVIVSVSLSVPRDATSDNSMSWYVPFAGVSPPSGEISP